jgi:hypothetical protein
MSGTSSASTTNVDTGRGPGVELAVIRAQMPAALAIEGLVVDGRPVCPKCGTNARGKTKVFPDGGLHCHKCGHHVANAIDLLVERGWSIKDAIRALSGDQSVVPEDRREAARSRVVVAESFVAHPDVEVYEAVLELGSTDAAVQFYSRWHISADAVRENRAVLIEDPRALATELVSRFGPERLVACGLASEKGALLVDQRYPVIEPHLLPRSGAPCSAMQFRASSDTERRIAEHKAYKEAKEAAEADGRTYRGPKAEYVPKFMSLRGASIAARCGFGLPRLAQVADEVAVGGRRRTVYLVEGFKDLLAARTLGVESYGLAGAGLLPVRAVCELLGRVGPIAVALDGDAAGDEGRQRLLAHLQSHGVQAYAKAPPEGMDMTDVLVSKRGV